MSGYESFDPDGQIISYSWSQESGPSVRFNSSTSPAISFITPRVTDDGSAVFNLTVSDEEGRVGSNTLEVPIRYLAGAPKLESNNPPVANNQSVITDVDTPVNITLTASDPDIDDDLTPIGTIRAI